MLNILGLLGLLGFVLWPVSCRALDAKEVLVLANANAAGSVGLAYYYVEKRQIPRGNLLKLWLTDKELCSRQDYEEQVARAVRQEPKAENAGAGFSELTPREMEILCHLAGGKSNKVKYCQFAVICGQIQLCQNLRHPRNTSSSS